MPSVVPTDVVTGEAGRTPVRTTAAASSPISRCPAQAPRPGARAEAAGAAAAAYATVADPPTGAHAAGRRRCSGCRCRLPSGHYPVHSRPGPANQPGGHTDLSGQRLWNDRCEEGLTVRARCSGG